MAAAVTPPLTLGEILDRTIQLYRRSFLLFLGISAAPAACFVLISGGFSLYFTSHAAQLQGTPNMQLMLTFFGVFAGFLIIGLPLLLAISSIGLSALNYAAFQRNHQEPVTIRAAYAYAFQKFWRYLGILSLQLLFASVIPGAVFAGIVVIGAVAATLMAASTKGGQIFAVLLGLLFFVLMLALLVAMVVIWLRVSLAFPASLVEGRKAWPSLQRSNQLSKGTRGRIFVMYLLVGILVIVAYYALVFPVDIVLGFTLYKSSQLAVLLTKPPVILRVINLFIGFLQRAFVMPIYCIGLLLFYNDQRTRLEGYDIELLMAQAGWANQQPQQPTPVDTGFSPQPFTEQPSTSPAAWSALSDAAEFSVLPASAEPHEAESTAMEPAAKELDTGSAPQPPEASGA